MELKRIVIDTDPGIDDSLAILLAVASPEVKLEGITVVHGNCSAEQGTINALSVLELAQASHIPVIMGCELPLVQPSLLAPETHGGQGLGYATLPAPKSSPMPGRGCDFLIDTILSNPGEITLVAIGPLTNVALAIRQEPRIVRNVREIFIMGGALRHEGNTTPLAEFNTFVDPHAAHIVYHSGMPITLAPLDVTYQVVLSQQDVGRLAPLPSGIPKFIADSTRFYMEFHDAYQKIEGCVINDPLALALTFIPELCNYEEQFVDVDLSGGVSMGNTFADFYRMTGRAPNMKVALRVRPREFMEIFLERMIELSRKIGKSDP
jgi:purine nucleosidase